MRSSFRSRPKKALVAVLAVVALTGAACSDSEDEASTSTTEPVITTTTAAGAQLTPVGTACSQVPTTGEGSVAGMADDRIATAASNNPLLTTLVKAVTQAQLADTLNGTGPFTVFAPVNSAFEKVPAADLTALLANRTQLTSVLTYHVVPGRMTVADLNDGASVATVQGKNVTIDKEGSALKVNTSNVICANVPVANGVVHLIDTVLTVPAA